MRRLLVLLLTAITLVAPACGDKATAEEILRATPGKTADDGSSKLALTMAMHMGGRDLSFTADGAVDYKAQRARMSMDLGALGLPGASGKVEMVMADKIIFMKMPAGMLPAEMSAKPWFKLDLAAIAQQQGVNLGSLDQLGNSNPADALAFLRGTADGVTEVGSEKVRGTDTTHYKATVDLRKAAEQQPQAKEMLDRAIDQMGISTMPVEAWVDGDGRLRRMRYELDLSKSAAAKQAGTTADLGTMRIDMELFDFGTKVDVAEPPADQVTDFGQMMNQSATMQGTVRGSVPG